MILYMEEPEMTTQQIRLAVETAARSSISAAAEAMNISQPNASHALKNLEKELGYPIFTRGSGGISPTEQGYRFLEHAQAMLREAEAMRSIDPRKDIPRLRVGILRYTPAVEAFFRYCRENKDAEKADLSCINISIEEGAHMLRERALDIIITMHTKSTLPLAEQICRDNRFTLTCHAKTQVCVRMRKEHPLVVSGAFDGTPQTYNLLSNYPYAGYQKLENTAIGITRATPAPFSYTYIIYSDERESRLRIIGETNAYSIGARMPQKRQEQYGLVSFPLSGKEAFLVSFVRKGDENRASIKRYLELLMEEFET